MLYILSHPRLTKSARPLAQKIGELVGEEILTLTFPDLNHKLVVRYGNSGHSGAVDTEYNSSRMIRLAGNKLRLSELLTEKNFSHVRLNLPHEEPDEFPIVIRTELNANGGQGIHILEEGDNKFQNNYWSYWYDFKFELGVHILGGKVAKVFKKVRQEGLEEEKYPVRNTQRGYSFKLKTNWEKRYNGLGKFVSELYKIVPISFARLDVGYVDGEGYKLIEINSAPSLSENENTLNMYAQYLAENIMRKE